MALKLTCRISTVNPGCCCLGCQSVNQPQGFRWLWGQDSNELTQMPCLLFIFPKVGSWYCPRLKLNSGPSVCKASTLQPEHSLQPHLNFFVAYMALAIDCNNWDWNQRYQLLLKRSRDIHCSGLSLRWGEYPLYVTKHWLPQFLLCALQSHLHLALLKQRLGLFIGSSRHKDFGVRSLSDKLEIHW